MIFKDALDFPVSQFVTWKPWPNRSYYAGSTYCAPDAHSASGTLDSAPGNTKWKTFGGFSVSLLKASPANSRMLISHFVLEIQR